MTVQLALIDHFKDRLICSGFNQRDKVTKSSIGDMLLWYRVFTLSVDSTLASVKFMACGSIEVDCTFFPHYPATTREYAIFPPDDPDQINNAEKWITETIEKAKRLTAIYEANRRPGGRSGMLEALP